MSVSDSSISPISRILARRNRNGLMTHFKYVHEPRTEDMVPFACNFGCGRRFREELAISLFVDILKTN